MWCGRRATQIAVDAVLSYTMTTERTLLDPSQRKKICVVSWEFRVRRLAGFVGGINSYRSAYPPLVLPFLLR